LIMQDVDLLVSYWTLAGAACPHSEIEYSLFDFKDRVSAAAKVGFQGIGLKEVDLAHTLERRSLKEMRQILDDNGIAHVELEFLTDWFLEGERKKKIGQDQTNVADGGRGARSQAHQDRRFRYACRTHARIPVRYLLGVELNDGTLECPWSLHEDTINHRRLCGEGEFDVKGFVNCLLKAGYAGPWGIEVLSEDLRKKPLEDAATRAFNTTIAQFPGVERR